MNTLYVNTGYGNSATLDVTMEEQINDFGNMTWRELLTEVIGESLDFLLQGDNLLNHYGVEVAQLELPLSASEVETYYDQLSFDVDNRSGAEALAFNLLESLQLFPMDQDGNGSTEGVTLEQTYANGPRKYVIVEDEGAAVWLTTACAVRGVEIVVKFV